MRDDGWRHITRNELTVRLTRVEGGYTVEYLTRGLAMREAPIVRARFDVDATHDGRALYDLLFPDRAVAGRVFAALSGSPAEQVAPDRSPVRLRVVTDDAALLTVPWHRATSPDGVHLVADVARWTFERTPLTAPDRVGRLERPARVLFVCPSTAEPFPDHARSRLAQDDARYAESHLIPTAHTPAECHRKLLGRQPEVVVFAGSVRLSGDTPALCFDGGAMVDADELTGALPSSVQLVVLCADAFEPAARLARALVAKVPAVIVVASDDRPDNARALTQHWLARVLLDGMPPVDATNDIGITPTDGIGHAIWTRYGIWQTAEGALPRARLPAGPVAHRLDRAIQKSALQSEVGSLMKADAGLLAVVALAPGDPAARPQMLSDVLRDHLLRKHCDEWIFESLDVPFPPGTANVPAALQERLRHTLRAGPYERLTPALHAVQPRGTPRVKGFIWLDFGGLGKTWDAKLTPGRVEDWLDFCAMTLAPALGGHTRAVAVLTVDTTRPEVFAKLVSDYSMRARAPGLRIEILGALEHVTKLDLDKFMRDECDTCPPDARVAAANKLFAATEGKRGAPRDRANFGCLVDAIEAAEAQGWRAYVGVTRGAALERDEEY